MKTYKHSIVRNRRSWGVLSLFLTVALIGSVASVHGEIHQSGPEFTAFLGKFEGGPYKAEFNDLTLGIIGGTFSANGDAIQFGGIVEDNKLLAHYAFQGQQYSFSATIDGDTMTLLSGAKAITLKRVGGAAPVARANAGPASDPALPARPAGDLLILQNTPIHDELAQCDAATILVPEGWKLEAGISWHMNPYTPAQADIHMFNPAGAQDMHFYPGVQYVDGLPGQQGQRMNLVELRHRVSPVDYVKGFFIPQVRRDLANAHAVVVKDDPEMARYFLARYNNHPAVACRAARVRFEYSVGRVEVEEDVYCALLQVQLAGGEISWSSTVQSFRAEKGRLDETMNLFRALRFSLHRDANWAAQVTEAARVVKEMILYQRYSESLRNSIIHNAQQKIGEMQRAMFEKSQQLQNESTLKWDEVYRNTQRAVDPTSGHQIEVPGGYQYGFVNPLGGKVFTNDPNYNPNNHQPPGQNQVYSPLQMISH